MDAFAYQMNPPNTNSSHLTHVGLLPDPSAKMT